jgi:hypothetical protein
MALVGLAALDCMAIRAPLSGLPIVAAMLLLGGLPMANLLAIGLLPLLLGRPGGRGARPSVVGFEVVGWATLLLYASFASHRPEALREAVVVALGSLRTHGNAAFLTAVMVALLLPQISLSLLGGWLNGRYDARVAIPWPTVTQDRDETASVPNGATSEVQLSLYDRVRVPTVE